MNYQEKIIKYMEQNNGYITNKIAKNINIPTIYLTRMNNDNLITRITRGIYMLPSYFEDELYVNYLRYNKIIYTKNTALVFNNMSNRSLKSIDANVPHNYNPHRIKEVNIFRVNDIIYNLGKTLIETEFGNQVISYDIERTICDIFINDDLSGEEIKYALDSAKEQVINKERLYNYSKELGIYEKIKIILEVL